MRQFYGRLEKCVLSVGKNHVHKIPRFRGGGIWVFFFGGGECRFIFMGARIFLTIGRGAPLLPLKLRELTDTINIHPGPHEGKNPQYMSHKRGPM